MQIEEMAVAKAVKILENLQKSDPENSIFKNVELYTFFLYLQMLLSCQRSSDRYRIAYQNYIKNEINPFYEQLYKEAKEEHEKNKGLKNDLFAKFISEVVQ